MKFHNNPFTRIKVNREQLFAEPTQTYIHTDRQTGISVRVFSFIALLETCLTKIWRDLDQCTDKNLNSIYIKIKAIQNEYFCVNSILQPVLLTNISLDLIFVTGRSLIW